MNIKENNSSIEFKEIDSLFKLNFAKYKTLYSKEIKEDFYKKYYQFNILMSSPKLYKISLLNYSRAKIRSSVSVGFELWRSLSENTFTGLGVKFTQMDYSYTQNEMNNKVDWQNYIITITGNVDQKAYEISEIEIRVKLGMGLNFSNQSYTNLITNENNLLSYTGIGVFFELIPTINYSFQNYNIFAGLGYSWSGFNYVFFNKNNKTSSRYLSNNYDSINLQFGLGLNSNLFNNFLIE